MHSKGDILEDKKDARDLVDVKISVNELIFNDFSLLDVKILSFGHVNRDDDQEDEEKGDFANVKIVLVALALK